MPSALWLFGNTDLRLPSRVDLFITCAGEDLDTVLNTVEAACALDYPTHCLRVIVLDDAGSKELSQKIEDLKQLRDNVHYTAREKTLDHHFKAGNLNYGYKFVETLPGGPAPFIAALDADMIPDPKWLRALMPHLLKDESLALAQPPQVCVASSHIIRSKAEFFYYSDSMVCLAMILCCKVLTSTLKSQSL